MFSDIAFGRLVWKEYRTHRPLWLALLIGTPLMQIGILVMIWINDGFPLQGGISEGIANALMATGFIASVVYLLGCCATMFSVEHETGVFDFQRVLPATQPRVFWAKVAFAFVSSLALTAVLWIVTRGMFLWSVPQTSSWFGSYGLLYMAEVFAWSIFASLLIRQPLWGVIAAIALQSLTMQVVLPYLTIGPNDLFNLLSEDRRFITSRFVTLVVLFVADVVLGRLWFEDRLRLPSWRLRWKPEFVPSYPVNVELPPYLGQRQVGWRRLLWLSWRDGRWVTAGVLAWYGYVYWTLQHPNQWEVLMLVSFICSFVIGLFAFAPEQWGGRFRYLTERGCTPRVAWLCRQALWLPPVLLMCLATNRMRMLEDAIHPHSMGQRVVDEMLAIMMPLVCYTAGQFAAMLFRSTVMAIAVGIGLCFVGGGWSGLMTTLLAPTWWAVGSLPVIGLFVTWLKSNDWIEERRDRMARWRTVLGVGLPIVSLLAVSATHRVVQIPTVDLPREWDETSVVMARLTAAEKETLAVYRRVLAEIEKGDDTLETYQQRLDRLKREHPDWNAQHVHSESFSGFHRDWLALHAKLVPLLRDAHQKPPVPLALIEVDLPTRKGDWNPEPLAMLPWLMIRNAEESVKDGSPDEAWRDIEMAFELQRRLNLRATFSLQYGVNGVGGPYDTYLLQSVVRWGRRKDQTRERVVAAIRKLEEIAAHPGVAHWFNHHSTLDAQALLNSKERWQQFMNNYSSYPKQMVEEWQYWRIVWNVMPWERWRSERAIRLQAWLELTHFEQARLADKWNVPLPQAPASQSRDAMREQRWASIPIEDRIKLNAASRYDHNSAEVSMLRMTLLPPNRNWGEAARSSHWFVERAESFRATAVLLALADFHREHGRYPESLKELVPTYFAAAPHDPMTVAPLCYLSHGLPEGVKDEFDNGQTVEQIVRVREGAPFLVTNPGGSISLEQLPNGSWKANDNTGKRIEFSKALRNRSSSLRVWPVEEQ